MSKGRNSYFSDLTNHKLSTKSIQPLLNYMGTIMQYEDIPVSIYKSGQHGPKITEQLTRLDIRMVTGNKSWEGLLVAFPGDRHDLTIKKLTSPYLRMILYPILDLHHRISEYSGLKMPCVYLVGDRFPDVIYRKFYLLRYVIPHVIILTNDLYRNSLLENKVPKTKKDSRNESWWQMQLCHHLTKEDGLKIPLRENQSINLGLLSHEVPAAKGTENPERLDILAYDKDDHSLVSFEIKGPKCGRVELENLLLQGLEHQNWLEKNKMAVKFLYDRGPKGRRINTKKRVRLILGFCDEETPQHFHEIRQEAERRDPYLKIDFVRMFKTSGGNISLESL